MHSPVLTRCTSGDGVSCVIVLLLDIRLIISDSIAPRWIMFCTSLCAWGTEISARPYLLLNKAMGAELWWSVGGVDTLSNGFFPLSLNYGVYSDTITRQLTYSLFLFQAWKCYKLRRLTPLPVPLCVTPRPVVPRSTCESPSFMCVTSAFILQSSDSPIYHLLFLSLSRLPSPATTHRQRSPSQANWRSIHSPHLDNLWSVVFSTGNTHRTIRDTRSINFSPDLPASSDGVSSSRPLTVHQRLYYSLLFWGFHRNSFKYSNARHDLSSPRDLVNICSLQILLWISFWVLLAQTHSQHIICLIV